MNLDNDMIYDMWYVSSWTSVGSSMIFFLGAMWCDCLASWVFQSSQNFVSCLLWHTTQPRHHRGPTLYIANHSVSARTCTAHQKWQGGNCWWITDHGPVTNIPQGWKQLLSQTQFSPWANQILQNLSISSWNCWLLEQWSFLSKHPWSDRHVYGGQRQD